MSDNQGKPFDRFQRPPWLIPITGVATWLAKTAYENRATIIGAVKNVLKGPAELPRYQTSLEMLKLLGHPLEIRVLGAEKVGKSTLVRRLLGLPEPNVAKQTTLDPHRKFSYVDPHTGIKVSGSIQDVGGQRAYQAVWQALVYEKPPELLIFLVDHETPDRHRDALLELQRLYRGSPALREKCRAMLLLVNKSDIWGTGLNDQEKEVRSREIVGQFADIVNDFDLRVVDGFCCASRVPPDPNLINALSKLLFAAVDSSVYYGER